AADSRDDSRVVRISRKALHPVCDRVAATVPATIREELREIKNADARQSAGRSLRFRSAHLSADRGERASRSSRHRETLARRRRCNSNAYFGDRCRQGLGRESESATKVLPPPVLCREADARNSKCISRDLSREGSTHSCRSCS